MLSTETENNKAFRERFTIFLSIDMMNVYQQPEKSDDSIIDLLL